MRLRAYGRECLTWRRWFAWYPVKAHDQTGRACWVWLEDVEWSAASMLGVSVHLWDYRIPR